jgi:ATP-dependent protease ClpP protease subunit
VGNFSAKQKKSALCAQAVWFHNRRRSGVAGQSSRIIIAGRDIFSVQKEMISLFSVER